MNKTKDKLVKYLLDYVEQAVEYPEITLQNIAYKINAEVTRDITNETYIVKKKEK